MTVSAWLQQINEELGKDTFLRDLFRPSAKTRPLLAVGLTLLDCLKGTAGSVRQIITTLTIAATQHLSPAFALGALLGALIMALVIVAVGGAVFGVAGLILLILAGWIGGLIASTVRLWKLLSQEVPSNFMGICTGRPEVTDGSTDQEDQTVLTDWLYARINAMAGLEHERPLTFGDLCTLPPWRRRESIEETASENNIVLRMMTSNLSQNQPYVLPFENHLFILSFAKPISSGSFQSLWWSIWCVRARNARTTSSWQNTAIVIFCPKPISCR